MKYISVFFALCLFLSVSAQENETENVLVNKKGVAILPQTGDWAIGLSASPFISFAGNLLSSDYTGTPYFSSSNPGSIFVKYHNSPVSAIRAGVSIGMSHSLEKDGSSSMPGEYDKYITSAFSGELSLGIEKYIGSGSRLRGYYGFDLGLAKSAYYGYIYQSYQYTSGSYSFHAADTSMTSFTDKGGNTYTLSGTGFIGFEYFFLPKISLSGEFGLQLSGAMLTDRKYIPEGGNEVIYNPGGFELNTSDISSASISLFVYF